jgi:AcrR family transcriptional regulator
MTEETSLPVNPENQDTLRGNIRQRIIEAASEVFASNGYARTTTRNLATAAGVTEVTLFRHFGSKENLFTAVVESYGGSTLANEYEAQFTGDYRSDLHALGKRFIGVALERNKIMRMMFSEVDHFPELEKVLALNPAQFRQMLSHYLARQIEQGTIRPVNTDAAAQAFWGMILAYSLIVDALKDEIPGGMSPEEAVTHFVNIFIDGTIEKE